MTDSHRFSGFTLLDLMLTIVAATIILALALPAIARGRALSGVDVSMNNLITLGVSHAIYAADWDGRQYTIVVDDLDAYGGHESDAYYNYGNIHGQDHPPLLLGWYDQGLWAYWMSHTGNHGMCQPLVWPGGPEHLVGFGSFRVPNAKQFHDYVDGRFYGDTFYAPNDTIAYGLVEWAFDDPAEYLPTSVMGGSGGSCLWSSYCFSPAAMFHPDVMRAEADGGWQNPWKIDDGFKSPGLFQAQYPNLKTQMIEHHWNQGAPPDPCNPAFEEGTYDGCEPYYFNHALVSEPATLFYDMSVRLLPNAEVLAADEQLIAQTGYGLWSRDTPFGEDGYFSQYGYDGLQLSHHVLTTDGILGRDTLPSGPVGTNRRFK